MDRCNREIPEIIRFFETYLYLSKVIVAQFINDIYSSFLRLTDLINL